MESWIEFGRGPLFRIAFSLMLLGLLRVGGAHCNRNSGSVSTKPGQNRQLAGGAEADIRLAVSSNAALARTASLQHVIFLISCRAASGSSHFYLRMSCYGSAQPGLHGSQFRSPWQTTLPCSSL